MTGRAGFDFQALFLSETAFVRSYAHHLCRDREAAEELAQQALFLIWRSRDQFQPGTSYRSWASTVTRNAFYASRRRDRFRGDLTPRMTELLVAPEDAAIVVELAEVRRAMDLLQPNHRQMLLMAAAGLSYDEMAAAIGCVAGTVRSRLSRARDALQATLNGPAPEPEVVRGRAHARAGRPGVDGMGAAA